MSVSRAAAALTIYDWVEAHLGIPPVVQATLLAIGLLMLAGWSVRRSLNAAPDPIMPDEGITLRNVLELVVEALATLLWRTIGPEWRRWFPLVATLFFFILISNLLGLLPGVDGATSDMNANVAWAILVFAAYHYAGVRKHGWRYVYQFMGPSLLPCDLAADAFGSALSRLSWFPSNSCCTWRGFSRSLSDSRQTCSLITGSWRCGSASYL